jgi:hypothetical protein
MGLWWKLDLLEMPNTRGSVYRFPCECGGCYMCETGRLMEVCTKEHKYNMIQRLLKTSKWAQHAYEDGHQLCWTEAKVLEIEPNSTYRKNKESAHISLVVHSISQPSLYVPPIIGEEFSKFQTPPAEDYSGMFELWVLWDESMPVIMHVPLFNNCRYCFICCKVLIGHHHYHYHCHRQQLSFDLFWSLSLTNWSFHPFGCRPLYSSLRMILKQVPSN